MRNDKGRRNLAVTFRLWVDKWGGAAVFICNVIAAPMDDFKSRAAVLFFCKQKPSNGESVCYTLFGTVIFLNKGVKMTKKYTLKNVDKIFFE